MLSCRARGSGRLRTVAVLSLTELVSWGVLWYAFAVFLAPVRRALGLATVTVSGALSLALIVAALAGVAIGRWLDDHDPRPVMAAGSLLASLCVYGWSRVHSAIAL